MRLSKERIAEIVRRLQKTIKDNKDDPKAQDLVKTCEQILYDIKDFLEIEIKENKIKKSIKK